LLHGPRAVPAGQSGEKELARKQTLDNDDRQKKNKDAVQTGPSAKKRKKKQECGDPTPTGVRRPETGSVKKGGPQGNW